MKQRDDTREKIKSASNNGKVILLAKYKKLRNLVNYKIRQESKIHTEKRIENANSDAELWRIASEVIHLRNRWPSGQFESKIVLHQKIEELNWSKSIVKTQQWFVCVKDQVRPSTAWKG